MRLLDYLGVSAHYPPPVIEGAQKGCIRRISSDRGILKPIKEAPVPVTLIDQNIAKMEHNRAEILRTIRAGVKHAGTICALVRLSDKTVWKHVEALEKCQLIKVDRDIKPWVITPVEE